ncbi:MAG: hypothetical protein ACRELG_10535 [Gemmataceae bacterium]
MAQVVLIPTGRLEHEALAPALKRLFPDHDFIPRPKEKHLEGFTSTEVTRITLGGPIPTNVEELAAELVASVSPGQRGRPVDFAFVVEDLELINDHQPGRVAQLFREAVDRHIHKTWSSQQAQARAVKLVQERCSFHLFRPMTEAYFFGDSAALRLAGVIQEPRIPAAPDLESFQTIDAAFLQLPNSRFDRIVDMPNRQRHPKSYLHYLCDPTLADRRRRYRETVGGVAALRQLDWQHVLMLPPHCPFLQAFLDDLAYALNHSLGFVSQAHAHPFTRFPGGQNRLLRNL